MEMGMGIRVVLLSLVVAITGHTQEPELHRIPKPAMADSAWAYVLQCTHSLNVKVEKGGDLRDVKWFVTELPHTRHELLIGMWRAPDSIVMDIRFINRKEWLAHELLHHLLRGPPEEPHPYVPFGSPCHLFPWQNGVFDNRTGILTLPDGTTVAPRHPLTNPLD